jgi:flagellar motor switch/type III secretory pathway protein FliN
MVQCLVKHEGGQQMKEWKSKADWRDPKWKYIPAAATDVSKTIARVRREMKELAGSQPQKVINVTKLATEKSK